jgi:NAD(P) transhydrogenase
MTMCFPQSSLSSQWHTHQNTYTDSLSRPCSLFHLYSLYLYYFSIAATLVADLIRSGIKIERGCQVGNFDVPQNPRMPMTIELREAQGSGAGGPRKSGLATSLKCDAYLAAVGRKPNTGNLNLAAAGISVDSYGGILVDSRLCTTATSGTVYAAGDVLGRPFLASTGVAQAKAAVVNMFANQDSIVPECDVNDPSCVVGGIAQAGMAFDPASLAANPFAFPTGVWSSPEAAYYGLSLQQAQKMDIDAGESMALYAECLRGRVFSPNGLLKLVFEKPAGRILGVHVCGEDACELIHYGMELIKGRRTVLDLCDSVYTAVTFHEMYKIAAQNALDEAGARKRRAAAGRAVQAKQRKVATKEQ